MTRRKPLPYAANQSLDDITMDAATILRSGEQIVNDIESGHLDHILLVVRLSKMMNKAYAIIGTAKGIKRVER